MTFTLAADDEFKVVKVEEGADDVWYPAGMGNNYVVDADHAGENKLIFFRPDGQGAAGWHEGYIYVAPNSGEGVDNVEAAVKAVKMLRDGQVVIVRGEHIYTIMGQMVK